MGNSPQLMLPAACASHPAAPPREGLNNSLPIGVASRWFSDHGISRVISCTSLGLSTDLEAVGGNGFDQRSPGNHLVHLVQEDSLAGVLQANVEVQGGSFHDLYFLSWDLPLRSSTQLGELSP